jgi:hypothetical protein
MRHNLVATGPGSRSGTAGSRANSLGNMETGTQSSSSDRRDIRRLVFFEPLIVLLTFQCCRYSRHSAPPCFVDHDDASFHLPANNGEFRESQ